MIEKLAKEFEKIRASLTKSKKLILSDIEKIDEKYRRLAQEEKKNLTESLGILNEQLKYYDKMLGNKAEVEETADSPDTQEEPEEPAIEDTIFPENNEQEEETVNSDEVIPEEEPESIVEEEESEAEPEKKDDLNDIWPEENTEEKPEEEKKDSEEDEWPDFPQEWN